MDYIQGSVCLPIFQSSIYKLKGDEDSSEIQYIRSNNTPTQLSVSRKIAALERGEVALVTSSGMAAISNALLTFLCNGSHLLAQSNLYVGTQNLIIKKFPELGIESDSIVLDSPEDWHQKIRKETKVIYVETVTNPTLEIGDLKSVVSFAKEHNLISIIDNTFATPINFNPLSLGFDLVIHSASKYLNGHLDLVAGCVVGTQKMIGPILERLNYTGSCLDPHACFLLSRGMETLALRVHQQNQNAMRVATFLEAHAQVERVIYPGLISHPQHSRAKALFRGYGGILCLELAGDIQQTKRFLDSLQIPLMAPSLGGVRTLITQPAATSHSKTISSKRKELGISDKLIRISIGIESPEDLITDLSESLDKLSGK